MTLDNASKYKKYFTVSSNGTITTKINSKVKIKKSIPVKVNLNGRNYTVNVKIVIPEPDIKIIKKNYKGDYEFAFKYDIKGATKINIRILEFKNDKLLNSDFDKYLSKPKSNSESYVLLKKSFVDKYSKLRFKITVYYGKNGKKTFTKKVSVK